jgi:hypothetical protein
LIEHFAGEDAHQQGLQRGCSRGPVESCEISPNG